MTANPDITKFSLPAVFLYPYSALELGAYRGLRFVDMLFCSAALEDPIERLVQVLAWSMTSSENEEFNKKPFNPVLGEELTTWTEDDKNGRTLFRAEQVEHHPPVSAFIMRNDKLDVTFACNVEFAVAFHGEWYLSMMMMMIVADPFAFCGRFSSCFFGPLCLVFATFVLTRVSPGNSVTISTRGYGEITFGKLGETYTISKYIPDLKVTKTPKN